MTLLLLACHGARLPVPDSADSRPPVDTEPSGDSDTAPVITDADGDGVDAIDAGGTDCDDADPSTYPGATEWCDPIDHDCDGEPLEPGVCGKVQDGREVGRWPITPVDGGIVSVHRTSYSGDHYLLISSGVSGVIGDGHIDYYDDPSEPPIATWSQVGSVVWTSEQHNYRDGDWDGDGYEDVVIISQEDPGVWVRRGPIVAGSDGRVAEDADYAIALFGGQHELYYRAGGEDLTGDGRPDLALIAHEAEGDTAPLDVDLVIVPAGSTSAEDAVYLPDSGQGAVYMLGDLTGDGISEVAVNGPDGATILDDAADRQGIAATQSPLAEWPEGDWKGGPAAAVGDWDGDGLIDAAGPARAWNGNRADNRLCFLSNPSGIVDVEALHCFETDYGGFGIPQPWSLGGREGMLVGVAVEDYPDASRETDGYTLLLQEDGMPPSVENVLDRRHLTWMVDDMGPAGDIDGDGFLDVTAMNFPTGEAGYLPGWDIPWDEPEWW